MFLQTITLITRNQSINFFRLFPVFLHIITTFQYSVNKSGQTPGQAPGNLTTASRPPSSPAIGRLRLPNAAAEREGGLIMAFHTFYTTDHVNSYTVYLSFFDFFR